MHRRRSPNGFLTRLGRVGLVSVVAAGVVAPVAAMSAMSSAGALDCTTTSCTNPTGVTFFRPGAVPFNTNHLCGIVGNYASLNTVSIDKAVDDPAHLGQTTEGNYRNSEAFQFTTTKELKGNDKITISLPAPAEPYSGAGSILPPAQTPLVNAQDSSKNLIDGIQRIQVDSGFPSHTANVDKNDTLDLPVQVMQNGTALAGYVVHLNSFDPYNPPQVQNGPGANPANQTSANIAHNDLTTDANGIVIFQVSDANDEEVVFGATVTQDAAANTINIPVAQTADIMFGTPTTTSGLCDKNELSSPATSDEGSNYILLDNTFPHDDGQDVGVVLPASAVSVSQASGQESVTLTLPDDPKFDFAANRSVQIKVMNAVSPPGGGNGCSAVDGFNTPSCYPTSAFSIATSVDPIPGSPSAPLFTCCATPLPVVPATSTLNASSLFPQVGLTSGPTATATLRDQYDNPVSNRQTAIYLDPQYSASHAALTPAGVKTGQTYPTSGSDGTASYAVVDTCAEDVHVIATDLTDSNKPTVPLTDAAGTPAAISFRPSAAVAPDDPAHERHLADCGAPPTTSKIQVDKTSVAADGSHSATVTVTLGDKFGNPEQCHQIALSASSTHASVVPGTAPGTPCASGAGASGPGITDTNGRATFTVSDVSVEDVVFSVTDVTLPSVWPSNAASSPLDVAVVHFLGVDQGKSTVEVDPAPASPPVSPPASNGTSAAVKVTLKDADGDTVQGKNVSLAAITPKVDPSTVIITPIQAKTAADGTATFNVGSTIPQPLEFQATDTTDRLMSAGGSECAPGATAGPCIVAQTVTITFAKGGAVLTAAPAKVVGDGIQASTATFTLTNQQGPVVGAAVTFTTTSPTVKVTTDSNPATTDANGQVRFTLTDKSAETVKLSVTANKITVATNVVFTSAPNEFDVSASPLSVPADGISKSKITVIAKDVNNQAIAGLKVHLDHTTAIGKVTITGGDGSATDSVDTDASGRASFNVSDTKHETITFTPQYLSDTWHACLTTCQSAPVTFEITESEASSITTDPPASAPGDGQSTIPLKVTLTSGPQNLANHAVVVLTGSATTKVVPDPAGYLTATTDTSGVVSLLISDTKAEMLTLYARDLTTGVVVTTPQVVKFLPTEAQTSRIDAVPSTVPAGGGRTTTVTVTLLDSYEAPISGHAVTLITGSSTTNVSSPSVTTDSSGQAVFTVSDTAVETLHIGARDLDAGITLATTKQVSFTASEPNQSSVTINPITTPAKGPAATLTVVLLDGNRQPIAGHKIDVLGATSTTTIKPLFSKGITDAFGQAQFAVTDTAVEQELFGAMDDANGITLDQSSRIQFTPAEANQTSISASVVTLPAGPIGIAPSTTVTVTLLDRGGSPIAGDGVSLSATSSTVSIKPLSPTTDANGLATFAVGDTAVESTTLTALDTTTGVTAAQTLGLTFFANEENQSSVTASQTIQQTRKNITITVTLKGANGLSLSGRKVSLATLGAAKATVSTTTKTGVTGSNGVIQFTVTDATPEAMTIIATDATGPVTIYQRPAISFAKP